MKKLISFPLSLVLIAIFCGGCDKLAPLLEGNWLVGTWVVDTPKTMDAFKKNNQRETPVGGIAGELASKAIRGTLEALIKPMENVQVVITDNEFVEKAGGGYSNKPRTYQIVERPAAGQIKTLDSNNEVRIFHKEDDHIWYFHKNNEKLQVYLKPGHPGQ